MSAPCRMQFERLGSDGEARRGQLQFPRGTVETPASARSGPTAR